MLMMCCSELVRFLLGILFMFIVVIMFMLVEVFCFMFSVFLVDV